MKILINEQISPHKYKTSEGYLVCVDSVLARTGKQTYTRDEVFNDGEEVEVEVDRPEEEVFSPETLASFENKPLTLTHPDEDVTIENFREYAVGFVRDIKKGMDEGKPVMLGTLVITDKEAIEGVESGKYKDLSCGYDCDIVDSDNPCQRNIRGNHVALCEQGRAGNARVVDSVDEEEIEKTYDVGYVDRPYDKAHYVTVKAKNEKEAEQKVRKKYDVYRIFMLNEVKDSIHDVEPRSGEKKEDFIERFMTATKSEYPDIKQRYAVANSYWNRRDSMKDEESKKMPAQLKKELKQHFGRISTYVPKSSRNKDVADFLKEWERWFRIDGKPITFNRESIKGWFKTDDGMMRKDYVFTVNDYSDRFLLSIYADPKTYDLTEMNAYFIDSVNDIDPYAKVTGSLEEEADNMEEMVEDSLVEIPSHIISKFERELDLKGIKIEGKGKTYSGRKHYQVSSKLSAKELAKFLHHLDLWCSCQDIPMTYSVSGDESSSTAGIDLDKQYVKDSKIDKKVKIAKIIKSISNK